MSFYQDKTVLVTGAAGFIGSHLVDALLAADATVIGVDNFITGNKKNLDAVVQHPKFTFIEADVINAPSVFLSTLPSPLTNLDCVFHLASPASPDGYQRHPIETYLVNAQGTHGLLQWILKTAPKARFLYTSTSEVYGDPLEHPQTESYFGNVNPNGPRSMYDESKRLGETICGVHHTQFGMDTRIVRLFNTYGPRMDSADGRVIPDFFRHIMTRTPIKIHGDGSQTRSFCFVSDIVSGLLAMVATDGLAGETVNLGNPEEITIKLLATRMIEATGSEISIENEPARVDDPSRRCPDITKAKTLLSWHPSVPLQEGINLCWKYFQD